MTTQVTTGDGITEQNASAAAAVRWSEIPYDVLGMIRARVGSPRGRVFFTSVCRSWRAAACRHPSPPAMPLLLLSSWYGMSHRYDNPMKMKSLYCLEDGEVMRVFPPRDIWSNWHVGGTDNGWIALWQSNEEPLNAVVITNLFSGTEVTLSEKQRTLVCKVCSPKGFLIRKIAFSEAPTSSSCILAAMTNTCRVAVCKVGCPDYGWTTHGCRERELHDIAFCQGELYGVTCYGEKLFKYDIGVDSDGAPAITAVHLLVAQTYASPTRWSIHDESVVYLIELRCKLVMAVRSRLLPPERKTSFNLFELVKDAEGYRWVEMRSLDEHALFLGPKCSRAVHVPAGGRRGVERNRIYYSNHRPSSNIESFSDAVYLTRTDDDDRLYCRKDERVSDDEIKSIGYHVSVNPCTPTWLLPPAI
uniref:Uncharacterized protein n=1 Tax=Avena sativa TaxID=4498 RepID=A0ACD5YNF2_AVESA